MIHKSYCIPIKETPFSATEDEGMFDSGCSRNMSGNKERLDDFHAFHGRKVTFGGGEGRITKKGTIHTECLVLSKDFQLPDDSMVVLKVPRKHNLYTINLNDLCPRGKQPKASYKTINAVSSISEPLQLLHMDLFGPTSIRSIDHKYYCLMITDDYSRFCWVFFLEHKDETYPILKNFINLIENQLNRKEWCDKFEALMKGEFQMSAMGELTFYLGNVRTTTTPYEAPKPKSKSESDSPVNVHLYRSMIGSLMYLTASRPYIIFAVSACTRHQVTPTTSNLEAVKKIFKYLKGQPKLGLWYPKESPLVLEAYSDSGYAGANKDRKSKTGGCQFLGRRLILWQCKKQTIVATSSTEAEYVSAANCCGQPDGVPSGIARVPGGYVVFPTC
nr:hypothetical protein [Tanacetum cinerariifolium]